MRTKSVATYRHPAPAKSRVSIMLNNSDIAPYLYGRAARIETETYVNQAMLRWVENQIEHLPSEGSLFGVQLRPTSSATLKVGDKLLRLESSPVGITKCILEVTGIASKDGYTYADTTTLFPPWYEGGDGFFDTSTLDDRDSYTNFPVLYLTFIGQIPELDPDNFFGMIMNFAGEFKTLVECWAMAFNKELRDPKYLSHDPYEGFWLQEFGRKYGGRFQHELVHRYLCHVDWDQCLTGINKIYNTRVRWKEIDLISPLLEQMQTDILEVMRGEPELILLFSEEASTLAKRRMRALFERYYGPKEMTHRPQKSPTPQTPEYNPRKLRIIPGIIALIQGGKTAAEREAARHIYHHITGNTYPA